MGRGFRVGERDWLGSRGRDGITLQRPLRCSRAFLCPEGQGHGRTADPACEQWV